MRENQLIEVEVTGREREAESLLLASERVKKLEANERNFRFEFEGRPEDVAALHKAFVDADIPVMWFRMIDVNLEEAFMKITEGRLA